MAGKFIYLVVALLDGTVTGYNDAENADLQAAVGDDEYLVICTTASPQAVFIDGEPENIESGETEVESEEEEED